MKHAVAIGVVGPETRGGELVRALLELPGTEVRWLCDPDREGRPASRSRFLHLDRPDHLDELLADTELDAVAIATPLATHAPLVLKALQAEKHVLVEPPLALTAAQAERLLDEAEHRGLCLMVENSLLFQPAVRKLKELIDLGRLGDVHYVYANNQTLVGHQRSENVLWALGPQMIAALLYLLEEVPTDVTAHGASYVDDVGEDIVHCHLRFPNGVTAHVHLSWIDPHVTHQLTVVGSKSTAVVDELETTRKLTIFGGGTLHTRGGSRDPRTRAGDIVCPRLSAELPLALECEHFVASIRSGRHSQANASRATSVVQVLTALDASLQRTRQPGQVAVARRSNGNVTPLVPRASRSSRRL